MMLNEWNVSVQAGLPVVQCVRADGSRLHADSRQIRSGDIFVACRGEYSDGRSFIPDAVRNGAAFVFWEDDGNFCWNPAWTVANQGVKHLPLLAGQLAAQLYDRPAARLKLWGVTGTNGKTSISQWLAQAVDILENRAQSGAVIGTVGNGFWGNLQQTTHTTPDAVCVQTLLYEFAQAGACAAALEVSSHGLDQARVNAVPFETAVFTNLTRDHLDYHGDMQAYGETKARLFVWPSLRQAVINSDDKFGAQLIVRLRGQPAGMRVYAYGFAPQADIRISELRISAAGMAFRLDTPWGTGYCETRLLGRFNVYNLAACVGVLCADGYPLPEVLAALGQIRPATGRMDCLMHPGKPLVVVDYAHTPDALAKALATLQEIKPQGARLWCVFGCGGNRDKGKRPLMGAAAQAGADKVVLTSDNPRMEEPQAIIDEILPGIPCADWIEADRRTAIYGTILQVRPQDIVLIAGKGHECYQDIQGEKRYFSDFDVAKEALAHYRT